MTENSDTPTAPLRLRDALRDNGLATAAMFLVVAVAIAGWAASFIALHGFAEEHIGLSDRAAWLVPATFDGAALSLSLLSFRAAIYGRASLGSLLYVYGFTALSSWINWIHISDPQGKFVSALLPIAAVLAFGKVLKEAREAYERRRGKVVFKVRGGLLMLRWVVDRKGTRTAIRDEILAIPVQALVGLGADTLARKAAEALAAKEQPAATNANPNPVGNLAAPTIEAEVAAKTAPTTDNPAPVDNQTGKVFADKPPAAKAVAKPPSTSDSTGGKTESLVAAALPAYRQILADNQADGTRKNPRPTAPQLVEAVPELNTESRAKQIRDLVETRWHPEMKPRFHLVEAGEPVQQAS